MGQYFSADGGGTNWDRLVDDDLWWVCGSSKVIGVISGAIILVYLHYQRRRAAAGDVKAANALILPVFQPVIVLMMACLSVELGFLAINELWDWDRSSLLSWGFYEWIRDGFPVLFLQRSVSRPAFKRAAYFSLIPAAHGMLSGCMVQWLAAGAKWANLYYQIGAVLIHVAIIKYFAKRESVLPYSYFMAVYRLVWIAYWLQNWGYISSSVFYYPILVVIGIMEVPLMLLCYHVMVCDTRYWRRGCTSLWRRSQSPLLDTMAVGLLTDTHDNVLGNDLQNMIETHNRALIDFALVTIDQRALLGSGAFSRVYSGMYRTTPVAVKFFVKLAEVTADTIGVYAKETSIAADVQHENIVRFHGLCVRPPTIFLIMELCSRGSLYGLLKKGKAQNWSLVRKVRMAIDACRAVDHLHKLGYVHRDLKSLNYLVTEDWRLKLTDFGLSRKIYTYTGVDDSESPSTSKSGMQPGEEIIAVSALGDDGTLTTRVGTSLWMSPEMLTGNPYNEKTDIYSLALVLWEIMAMAPPFEELPSAGMQDLIVREHRRPEIPAACPPIYARCMSRGWASDPFARPTAGEMVFALETLLRELESGAAATSARLGESAAAVVYANPAKPAPLSPTPHAVTVTVVDESVRSVNSSSSDQSHSRGSSGSGGVSDSEAPSRGTDSGAGLGAIDLGATSGASSRVSSSASSGSTDAPLTPSASSGTCHTVHSPVASGGVVHSRAAAAAAAAPAPLIMPTVVHHATGSINAS